MKTIKTTKTTAIKVATGVKAGGLNHNHSRMPAVLRVKTGLRAGDGILLKNHSVRLLSR